MNNLLFNTNRAYLMHIGNSLQDFLHAILLQGMHSLIQRDRQQLCNSRMLLDGFFD